jgi:hypothetical protein
MNVNPEKSPPRRKMPHKLATIAETVGECGSGLGGDGLAKLYSRERKLSAHRFKWKK